MSSILQILQHPKFEIHWTSGSKVIAKKLTFSQQKVNFLFITFEPVVWLIPNFECGKICLVDGLFAKAVFKNKVARLEDKWPGWERNSCILQIYRIFIGRRPRILYFPLEGIGNTIPSGNESAQRFTRYDIPHYRKYVCSIGGLTNSIGGIYFPG